LKSWINPLHCSRIRASRNSWLLAAFLGVAFGRRFYANYFIQMLPAMSILGATGLAHLLDNVRRYRARAYLTAFALLVPFVFFHTRTMAHWYYLFNQEAHQKAQLWRMHTALASTIR
ncbi:MAG: hypothetical protein ACE15E_22455, partial [Acidobacteriota bacterium]